MKTIVIILLTAVCITGYSQKKPKINQALSALNDGDLAEAKTIIDEAIVHEKTKENPKTWFYRGQIYAALDTANNEPKALDESLKAFNKSLMLDPLQKTTSSVDLNTGSVVNVDSKIQGYFAYYYNKAITNYKEEEYTSAADNFETAFYIMPSDTSAVLYAAYSSAETGDDKRAKDNFNKSYDAGVRNRTIFLQLYNYAVRDENYEEGLEIVRRAREVYPSDIEFITYEINLLIRLKRVEEAEKGLEKAIVDEPNNADLLFSLGVLKEESGDVEAAMESYNKAVKVDPNHYNSIFNIGVSIFNEATTLIKERNALNFKERTKINELTTKINKQLKNSLPMWEKLYSLNSTDQTVLETLAYIYSNLKMKEEAEKIAEELISQGKEQTQMKGG